MRVHSNFAEYIPLSLFLIYLAEAKVQTGFSSMHWECHWSWGAFLIPMALAS